MNITVVFAGLLFNFNGHKIHLKCIKYVSTCTCIVLKLQDNLAFMAV